MERWVYGGNSADNGGGIFLSEVASLQAESGLQFLNNDGDATTGLGGAIATAPSGPQAFINLDGAVFSNNDSSGSSVHYNDESYSILGFVDLDCSPIGASPFCVSTTP
jgi:hypothetical protein